MNSLPPSCQGSSIPGEGKAGVTLASAALATSKPPSACERWLCPKGGLCPGGTWRGGARRWTRWGPALRELRPGRRLAGVGPRDAWGTWGSRCWPEASVGRVQRLAGLAGEGREGRLGRGQAGRGDWAGVGCAESRLLGHRQLEFLSKVGNECPVSATVPQSRGTRRPEQTPQSFPTG